MKILQRDISGERLLLAAVLAMQALILGYLFLVSARVSAEKEVMLGQLSRHIRAERIAFAPSREDPSLRSIDDSSPTDAAYHQALATHDEMDKMLRSLFGATGLPALRSRAREENLFQLAGSSVGFIDRSHSRMLSMFDSAFEDFRRASEALAPGGQGDSLMISPAMDMREFDDCYVVAMSLPRAGRPDVSVMLDGRVLSVQGRHEGRQGESWEFEKCVQLPGPIDVKSVRASLTNGVLQIVAPKAAGTVTDDKPSRIM